MLISKKTIIDKILFLLFVFCFSCFILRLTGYWVVEKYPPPEKIHQENPEIFNPDLIRLNTMKKLGFYCDSLYDSDSLHQTYPEIISAVIREKFYHGYSYYNILTNPSGFFLEPMVRNGANAIVIPDDIVKYPNAACSQQSIVGMELFRQKGYKVRKVGMFDSVTNSGHFCYEVYYYKQWHFFDTNQEPDLAILNKHNRPSIEDLAKNPEMILTAYKGKNDPGLFLRLLTHYKLGPVNKYPAPNAFLYQRFTHLFNFFGWIFIGAIIFFRSRLKRSKSRYRISTLNTAVRKEFSRSA